MEVGERREAVDAAEDAAQPAVHLPEGRPVWSRGEGQLLDGERPINCRSGVTARRRDAVTDGAAALTGGAGGGEAGDKEGERSANWRV